MSKVVIVGSDPDNVTEALEERGADVAHADGTANRPALEEAGIVDADLLVVTDAGLATAITVANDLNPDLRVVIYAHDSVPEAFKGQAGHIIDPELLGSETLAEELV
ncbi:MAG: Trk K+ transport system NAD-binding subunit [Natronomonas sp.]|jgi:Trk K+ transport system NAD-binding subunit|uniref:DUF7126 family protein n=1 Tax=Natronomonas sp. TaxID=2184060 RepID=UPI0039E44C91